MVKRCIHIAESIGPIPILPTKFKNGSYAVFKFLLEKPAIWQEFENLAGEGFLSFIQKEADKRGLKIDRESGKT